VGEFNDGKECQNYQEVPVEKKINLKNIFKVFLPNLISNIFLDLHLTKSKPKLTRRSSQIERQVPKSHSQVT
jgi:hypothetical protein